MLLQKSYIILIITDHYNTQTHHIPASRNITLHHRIRDNSHNPDSQSIKDFDQRIASDPLSLTDEDVEEYVNVSLVIMLFASI